MEKESEGVGQGKGKELSKDIDSGANIQSLPHFESVATGGNLQSGGIPRRRWCFSREGSSRHSGQLGDGAQPWAPRASTTYSLE